MSLLGCSGASDPPLLPPIEPTGARPTPAPGASADGAVARRDNIVEMLHGVPVADPYRWLERGDSAETKAWVAAMGKSARRHLDGLPGRDALERRLTELSYVEAISSPRRRGERYFFSRRHKDKEKVVWYWRQGKRGEPRVLIDPNTLSSDGSVALKGVWPSYDGKRVAYKLSENNADEATMYVMDVASGKKSEVDTIVGAKYASASWDAEGTGFYYTRLPVDPSIPTNERPGHAEIYFHRIGSDPKGDKLVHPKTGDATIFLSADVSRDGRYLFVYKFHGWEKNDLYIQDVKKGGKLEPFVVGVPAKFYAYAWKKHIYLHSDHQAPRWRLFRVDPDKLARDAWREIVPERPKAVLEDFFVVGDHLALRYLENASSRLEIAKLDGRPLRAITLPGIGSVDGPTGNPEDDEFYYSFSSYTSAPAIYESSVKKGGQTPYFTLEVPVDPAPYEVEQVWYASKDGTKVSMFVIRRKDLVKDGRTPFLLTGYGGFALNETPEFTATRFAWLDRGGAIAIPNLRGGAEYGEEWHRAGMRDKKQNVFDDFIAAAEYLIREGYTKPERLAISGGSNGGLLVGASMTQRPDLFGAVVCGVPLLDMVRYHLFGSGRTWVSEYGSSEDPKLFRALYAYSPYHRVKSGTVYPALLMLSADSDDRVDPLHARKFLAAIRHAKRGDRPALMRLEEKAGHGGGDLVKKEVARLTDVYSFLFHELGMRAQ
jgi:prolyl oligopeptidase